MTDLYRCSPRQTAKYIEDCIYAGLTPFVQSSPGMGKSTIMRNVARRADLQLIDHRLSTSAPEDLSGLPGFIDVPVFDENKVQIGTRKEARFHPFADLFPLRGDKVPDGKKGR